MEKEITKTSFKPDDLPLEKTVVPNKRKKIFLIIKYGAYCFLTLLLFLYLTFPFHRLDGIIRKEVRGTTGWILEMGRIDSHFISGLIIERFKLTEPVANGQPKLLVDADKTSLWLNPIAYLFGTYSLRFSTGLKGGSLSGEVAVKGGQIDGGVDISKVRLEKIPILTKVTTKEILGQLNGSAEASLDLKDLSTIIGFIDLSGKGITIEENTINTQMGPFTLPKMTFNDAVLNVVAKDGVVQIGELHFNGTELSLSASGSITLKRQWQLSKLEIGLKIKLGDELASKYDIIFQQTPKSEGYYNLNLVGTIGHPRCPQLGL